MDGHVAEQGTRDGQNGAEQPQGAVLEQILRLEEAVEEPQAEQLNCHRTALEDTEDRVDRVLH